MAAMLATKRLTGVAPEVNHRECITCMPLPSANKVPTLALKPRGDITRSPKQGYQWPLKAQFLGFIYSFIHSKVINYELAHDDVLKQ